MLFFSTSNVCLDGYKFRMCKYHTLKRLGMSVPPHQRIVILDDGFRLTEAEELLRKQQWTTRWSDGENIPFGLALPKSHYFAKSGYHFYFKGLWIFAANHKGSLVDGWDERHAGLSVKAFTANHAIYLLRKQVFDSPAQGFI